MVGIGIHFIISSISYNEVAIEQALHCSFGDSTTFDTIEIARPILRNEVDSGALLVAKSFRHVWIGIGNLVDLHGQLIAKHDCLFKGQFQT
jgi:hypothetical protein